MAIQKLRRRGLRGRALMVSAIAIIGVAIAGLAALSDEPSKPGPVSGREGAFAPPPAPVTDTVPARATPPDGVTCPDAWTYFDNPVLHYGICVPSRWGFSDFRGSDPLDQIPTAQLENLHLLGNAFPWKPGTFPFDAVKQGAIEVELNVLPAGTTADGECQPATEKVLGTLSVLTCEQLYGDDGMPAAFGVLRALKVIVPLRTGPVDEPGARLLIIARSRIGASLAEVTTLWQIVQHIHTY